MPHTNRPKRRPPRRSASRADRPRNQRDYGPLRGTAGGDALPAKGMDPTREPTGPKARNHRVREWLALTTTAAMCGTALSQLAHAVATWWPR
jgi:hypothetical protein